MNVWKTLGIAEDSDIKTIKRAYAKLLKKNRPDESPAAFQQLNTAYRQAIESAEKRQHQDKSDEREYALSPVNVDIDDEHQHEWKFKSSMSISSEWDEQAAFGNTEIQAAEPTAHQDKAAARESAWETLIERVDELLLDTEARCHILQWRFLGNSSWLLEDSFNHELGVNVFDRIAWLNSVKNENESSQEELCVLPWEILVFLDGLFNWKYKRQYLVNEFGEKRAGVILNALDVEVTVDNASGSIRGGRLIVSEEVVEGDQKQWLVDVSLAKRMCALALDLIVFSIVAFIVSQNIIFGFSQENISLFDSYLHDANTQLSFLIGFPLLSWVLRWSTPGKWLMGYQIYDGKTCNLELKKGIGLSIAFALLVVWLSFIRNLISL